MNDQSRLTPETVLSFKSVTDAQISPEGSRIAFVVGDSFKSDSKFARSSIWMVDTSGSDPYPFTRGPRTDLLPRWSPDGKLLAFLSDRLEDGQLQVCVIPAGAGEAQVLTQVTGAIPTPRGLNALQWSTDGATLAFLMEDPKSAQELEREKTKDDAIEFEQHPRYVRLWTVDIESAAVECVSPDDLQIWEFALHPTRPEVAAVVSDVPYEWAWYSNRLVSFSHQGTARTLHHINQVALPRWSPDGARLAFVSSTWSDRGCAAGDVWSMMPGKGEARNLTENMAAGLGGLNWSADSSALYAIGHERGGSALYRINIADSATEQLWWQQAAVTEANSPTFTRSGDRSGDGTIALIREDADHPRDVWINRDGVEWNQLTDLHPQAAPLEIGKTEVFHWKGADGWDMQGLLIRPVGGDPEQPAPLVMNVHGGPTGVSGSRYNAAFGWNQLLATAGCAVFMPNFRGSVGWGRTFSQSNLGDMGGKDFEDMMLGIDALIDAGIADPDRLAVTGWSYGGFIAAWAVSQTDRFKASVMGAGISHWVSFHGKSCLSSWDELYYQTSPYQRDGLYEKFSAVNYWDNLKTPTLILHGEQDQDVPVEQSYLFFRALKDKGVPTELVVYPREAHGVGERAHMLDMSRRVTRWLGRYLQL